MLKMTNELTEKMQNEDGFWTEEFEHGFYAYVNKNHEIDVCNEHEKNSLKSYGYNVIWVSVKDMGEDIQDVIDYVSSQMGF